MQIWSRNPRISEATKPSNSTMWIESFHMVNHDALSYKRSVPYIHIAAPPLSTFAPPSTFDATVNFARGRTTFGEHLIIVGAVVKPLGDAELLLALELVDAPNVLFEQVASPPLQQPPLALRESQPSYKVNRGRKSTGAGKSTET